MFRDIILLTPWILVIIIFGITLFLINVILYFGYFFSFLWDKIIFIPEGDNYVNKNR